MKKLFLSLFFGLIVQAIAFSQCQDINFYTACGTTNTTSDNCPYFTGSCGANWGRTNGSPQMNPYTIILKNGNVTSYYAFMWSARSGSANVGEGIFYSFGFQQGQPVTITVHAATGVQGNCSGGTVNVWAMTGFVQPPVSSFHCGDPTPNIPASSKQLIGQITALNPNVNTEYVFSSFLPSQNWNQIWIDPEATCSVGQYNLAFNDIQICPGCASTVTYNNGAAQIPSGQITGSYIYAGSSAPSGGSGTVAIQSTQQTQFIAVNEIDLLPNFQAIVSGSGYFGAVIHDCSYVPPISDLSINYDSVNLQLGSQTVEYSPPKSLYMAGQTNEDTITQIGELYHKLSVYPTITTGIVYITGRKVDLANSEIIVVDELGRVVYRLNNETNTSITLNLDKLHNGVYYIQIKNQTKNETRKFVITK